LIVSIVKSCYYIDDMAVDNIDKELIRLMQINSKQSSYKLSKQLMLSPSAVRRRKRELIEEGIIKEAIYADEEKLGNLIAADLGINVNQSELDAVYEAILNLPAVKYMAIVTGNFDIMALIKVGSPEELISFIQNEILKIKGVLRCESHIFLRMDKNL
jgi:DNA-binding Lrp family transcriptional regulator